MPTRPNWEPSHRLYCTACLKKHNNNVCTCCFKCDRHGYPLEAISSSTGISAQLPAGAEREPAPKRKTMLIGLDW